MLFLDIQNIGMTGGELIVIEEEADKKSERRAFILLVVFLSPILSVMVVGGYGFVIWMSQTIFGPPGS